MQNLYNKLKIYSIKDAISVEQNDRQFLALEKLWKNIKSGYPQGVPLHVLSNYLFLIITNALICYQLSGKGEDYWEEFSSALENKNFKNFLEIYNFFEKILSNSKNNKRFIDTKLKRIEKTEKFYKEFILKSEFYYKNMDKLVLDLSKTMNQKKEAKTIVFAVKMFSYGARSVFGYLEYFSENLMIPVDSRLEKLYKQYNNPPQPSFNTKGGSNKEIKEFYIKLSKKLHIPLLHLDAILWVNYEELRR